MAVFDVVKGSRWGMSPTEQTVSLNGWRISQKLGTLKQRASEIGVRYMAIAERGRAFQLKGKRMRMLTKLQ